MRACVYILQGFDTAADFVRGVCEDGLSGHKPRENAVVVCAWGVDGAWAARHHGAEATRVLHSPAFPPAGGVVDTIGAGDTFNGGFVYQMAIGADVSGRCLNP